jgi:hypothetical protein
MHSSIIRIEYPEPYLAKDLQEWNDYMSSSKPIKDAVAELEAREAFHLKKAAEMRDLIKSLKLLADNGEPTNQDTVTVRDQEFVNTGIAESAAIMIRRAKRPLHVSEIVKGLEAGGYHFKAKNPESSVAPVLYLTAANKEKNRFGIIKKPKNTYSLKELEDRTIQ